ncbi:hypothetical protein AN643_03095 [Candidatus Epulonipiscioides saccharophilum]|nr:hypothetical protein AN643_03095 [Epulopiscium sp. SCG-B10WGA-EpuloB]
MIKQKADYLAQRKKFFIMRTLIWASVILAIFITGWVITQNRANYFTVVAAVLTLGLAQNLTRYLAFSKYKNPDIDFANDIDLLDDAWIYHSVIIPTKKGDKYFPHVILKANLIFFITYEKNPTRHLDDTFFSKFTAKGIEKSHLHFCSIQHRDNLAILLKQIKGVKPIEATQESNAYVLEGMMV